MGRNRYKFFTDEIGPYFITCTIINWLALFGKPEITQIILDSLKYLIDHQRIVLHGFVIMEDHLHLIASGQALSDDIGDFKSFTARSIIDLFKAQKNQFILSQLEFFKKDHKITQQYQLWEEGNHPEFISSREMLNQKLEYLHCNPLRKGYIDDPAHWRYSSYRIYMGQEGLLPIEIIGL